MDSAKKKVGRMLSKSKATVTKKGKTPVAAGPVETNIFVAVRVRPKTSNELVKGIGHTVELLNDKATLIFDPSNNAETNSATGPTHRSKNQAFSFDCVLGPDCSQSQVYDSVARDVVPSLLEGFNASIFAYGQTSAGKTFTMLGDRVKGEGVMDLFSALEEEQKRRATSLSSKSAGRSVEYALAFSYLEVYNESIYDLLAEKTGNNSGEGLELRDGNEGDVQVLGISEHKLQKLEDVMALLERGNSHRSQSATDANETSSRSHAVLQVHVRKTERKTVSGKVKTIVRRSKLSMIDLAGSERAKATMGRELSLRKEGQNINKSLLSLGNCINALSSGSSHVPFRDSKLTRLLKDSLGGNCKTIMIANISPCQSNYEDTYNTLNYAKRAKNIRVTLSKAQLAVATTSDNFNLAQIEALRDENERLRELLRAKNNNPDREEKGPCNGNNGTSSSGNNVPSPREESASLEAGWTAYRHICSEAEALFNRKLLIHKQAFSSWIQLQWARVRIQILEQQLCEYRNGSESDTLKAALDTAKAQQSNHVFDIGTSRRLIQQVEEDIAQLKDETRGVWGAFGPQLEMMRASARGAVEAHMRRYEGEMMKRECNVLRTLVESGWELSEAPHAIPTSPEAKTPLSLKLTTASPGLKMGFLNNRPVPVDEPEKRTKRDPERPIEPQRLTFEEEVEEEEEEEVEEVEERFVAAAVEIKAPVFVERKVLAVPESKVPVFPARAAVSESKVLPVVEEAVAAPLFSDSIFNCSMPKTASRISSVSLAEEVASSVSIPDPQQHESMLSLSISLNDEVPMSIRSFGSSLSKLQSALSTNSNTAKAAASPAAPAPSSSRTSIRERLQKMVRERVQQKKEEDVTGDSGGTPGGVKVEDLAFSPVPTSFSACPDETMPDVSDLSLISDSVGKVSLSFAASSPSISKKPVLFGKTGGVEAENMQNVFPAVSSSFIPRPGPKRVLREKK